MVAIYTSKPASEKIFLNIIVNTRLVVFINNENTKQEVRSKKFGNSVRKRSTMSKTEQKAYHRSVFGSADFTKPLYRRVKKQDLFNNSSSIMKSEIDANLQLIIDSEFCDNPGFRKLCNDFKNKALKFNIDLLFKRFGFKIGKGSGYSCPDYEFAFVYGNGHPVLFDG